MDRVQVFPGAIPLETDILNTNKNAMIGLSKLAIAMLGASTQVNGLTCAPNSPAALNVIVGPGEIYSMQNIDSTAYSSLPADTAHTILKQGILLDAATLATPAPATAGQSINYLIQAAFAETDSGAVVLPYYNASNPATAYSGPAGAGTTNNTVRKGVLTVTVKSGIAATTGSQTTPAADSGCVGLYAVTVANGQSTVQSGNIAALATAPFITPLSGYAKVISAGTVVGSIRNARMSVATASASATFMADEVVLETALGGTPYRIAGFSGAINLASTGAGGMDTGTAPANGFVALYAIFNTTTLASALLAVNATSAAAPQVYAGANMPSGYTASALVSVWPTNGSSQFIAGIQADRAISFAQRVIYSSTSIPTTPTSLSIAGAVPFNARVIHGTGGTGSATTAQVYGLYISADGVLNVQQITGYTVAGGATGANFRVVLTTPQTVFYNGSVGSGTTFNLNVTGYEF